MKKSNKTLFEKKSRRRVKGTIVLYEKDVRREEVKRRGRKRRKESWRDKERKRERYRKGEIEREKDRKEKQKD